MHKTHTIKDALIPKTLYLHTNSFYSIIRLHDINQSLFHMNKIFLFRKLVQQSKKFMSVGAFSDKVKWLLRQNKIFAKLLKYTLINATTNENVLNDYFLRLSESVLNFFV